MFVTTSTRTEDLTGSGELEERGIAREQRNYARVEASTKNPSLVPPSARGIRTRRADSAVELREWTPFLERSVANFSLWFARYDGAPAWIERGWTCEAQATRPKRTMTSAHRAATESIE
jgi:hypothetical protein